MRAAVGRTQGSSPQRLSRGDLQKVCSFCGLAAPPLLLLHLLPSSSSVLPCRPHVFALPAPSDQQLRNLIGRQVFNGFDSNGSGFVTKDDLAAAVQVGFTDNLLRSLLLVTFLLRFSCPIRRRSAGAQRKKVGAPSLIPLSRSPGVLATTDGGPLPALRRPPPASQALGVGLPDEELRELLLDIESENAGGVISFAQFTACARPRPFFFGYKGLRELVGEFFAQKARH